MTCPQQAKFRYVDKLPDVSNAYSAFGSCVHHALEFYNNTADVEGALDLFREVWDDPGKIGSAFEFFPKYTSYSGMLNRGVEMIREYHEKQKWETRLMVAAEHRFNVPLGDHNLVGIVDLLEIKKSGRGKNTLKIVDYKTSSRPPYSSALRVNVQFTAYHYASMQQEFWVGDGTSDYPGLPHGIELWDKTRNMPRQTYWYQLSSGKEISAGERDDADFMRMYRVVNEIERAVEHGVFVPSISGESCVFCPYTEPCGLPIPKEDLDDEEMVLF